MKYILASLCFSASLLAAPQDEVLIIETLIETTKKNLDHQERLLQQLKDYLIARDLFLFDPDNGRYAASLVKKAMSLYTLLYTDHLTHLFSSDFLSELAFYNTVGKEQFGKR